MVIDISKIKKLIQLIEETSIAEIELKEGEESVRLSRQGSFTSVPPQAPAPTPSYIPTPISAAPTLTNESNDKSSLPAGHVVCSPMVGTMYDSPSPDAEPFVRVGQDVKVGDTLCIIEAMKMFNEIEADKSGKIIAVQVSNGDPVEFDQPLFVIE